MGLIVLIAIGAVLGCAANVVSRTIDGQGMLLNVVLGALGALAGGTLVNAGSLLVGVSPMAIAMALACALASLFAIAAWRRGATVR